MWTYQLYAYHPLIDCEFILSCKVVQMPYQPRRKLPDSRGSFGACCVDDCICKVRVELVLFATRYCRVSFTHFVRLVLCSDAKVCGTEYA